MLNPNDLRDRIEHDLRFVDRGDPYYFSYAINDDWEGCRAIREDADHTVIRWSFKDPKQRDFELRAKLLTPVAAWLRLCRYAVSWHQDNEGPFLRVARS